MQVTGQEVFRRSDWLAGIQAGEHQAIRMMSRVFPAGEQIFRLVKK
jgi:hypothetical protein